MTVLPTLQAVSTKPQLPAVDGLFTTDDPPHLIGGKVPGRESYFFPKHLGGGDPHAEPGAELEEVALSRRGKVWSFTNSAYPPPPPFVVTEPYEPVVIAAVELEAEKMVVLGQVVDGLTVDDLEVGMEMELAVGPLYEDDDNVYLTWKWKPAEPEAAAESN
ncbi:MAG: benzoylsuccinyl-CoA thiolase [Acidimicrobiales bacterium]|nr:benzoylsuccinyl-CoA thiolase [Acidimicrobiales bacterium]